MPHLQHFRVLLPVALLLATALLSADPVRILVTDSQSWKLSGGFAMKDGTGGGSFSGGARPQTIEVIKNFSEKCKGSVVTMDRAKADYVVLFDHEGGKGAARKDNKIAVFNTDGDLLYTGSTRTLGNAVKDACRVIGESN
jgi:hypothetical protein